MKHKISDCEPGCAGRTYRARRLVKEDDMGEIRSGIMWPKRSKDGVFLGMVGTRRKRAERTWGVEREGGVNRWWQKWWEQKQWAKKSRGQLTSAEKSWNLVSAVKKGMGHGWGSRGGRREKEQKIVDKSKNCSDCAILPLTVMPEAKLRCVSNLPSGTSQLFTHNAAHFRCV